MEQFYKDNFKNIVYLFGKGKSFEQPESVWLNVEQGKQNNVGGVIKEVDKY